MHRRAAACLVATALLGRTDRVFGADEKLACVNAADAAQQQRSAGKLRQARASLHICAREVCPAIVRSDCTQWLSEVEASVPTIVLRAQDPRGQDLTDVKVQLDGVPIADKIDGLPIEVDPGQHVLSCEHSGSKKLRQDIVVRTGDRNRTLSVVLEDVEPLLPVVIPPPTPITPSARPSTAVWVLGGVAVAATGTFAYFGIRALADYNRLKRECAPSCDPSDSDAVGTKLDVASVALGVAVVSGGIATYLVLSPPKPPATTLPAREIMVMPLLGGASASWTERF
jgi:hypothetical protein